MDNENALLALLAQNLDDHFHQLVQEYQNRLYSFAFRLTASSQDAEDIVQEVLLGVYITLSHYSTARICMLRLRPWLYKITLNVFHNHHRGARLLSVPLDSSEGCQVLDLQSNDEDHPEVFFESIERQQEVVELIHTLPEHYRLVVTCYYFEELSYQEIADLLDQPIGTVKSRLHRSIQMLRQQLQSSNQQRSQIREIHSSR
jgi:RNA polymerase sigma-70 factor (ECF subfamily)